MLFPDPASPLHLDHDYVLEIGTLKKQAKEMSSGWSRNRQTRQADNTPNRNWNPRYAEWLLRIFWTASEIGNVDALYGGSRSSFLYTDTSTGKLMVEEITCPACSIIAAAGFQAALLLSMLRIALTMSASSSGESSGFPPQGCPKIVTWYPSAVSGWSSWEGSHPLDSTARVHNWKMYLYQ
ncbi:hypothetical protein PFICI_13753 [Pestalotiopsis fici W106-1]|uniref:Uncharacterized protein n=1 Tax=Pestalotiopsis fici (strain W106-1 / CGMCC3.15140) TaxID=1229662 RepID=W3WL56_PESFW|nr:uncharacterized protein PFICI_13753 [Pestalotiopsis fici W106-1]ETS73887.1 hypothetical protein PFICI_13753 [Pestalotiopsis fici W106-1]